MIVSRGAFSLPKDFPKSFCSVPVVFFVSWEATADDFEVVRLLWVPSRAEQKLKSVSLEGSKIKTSHIKKDFCDSTSVVHIVRVVGS